MKYYIENRHDFAAPFIDIFCYFYSFFLHWWKQLVLREKNIRFVNGQCSFENLSIFVCVCVCEK